jgi:hypothetical protein
VWQYIKYHDIIVELNIYIRGFQTVWRPPLGGRFCSSLGWGGAFILNEIGQNTFGRHFAWLKSFTYHSVTVLAPNYKQHILSPAKIKIVCYSLAEHYVKSVYLNLFWWRGREVHETF